MNVQPDPLSSLRNVDDAVPWADLYEAAVDNHRREAILDIALRGSGQRVITTIVDGRPVAGPVIAAGQLGAGRHTVELEVAE